MPKYGIGIYLFDSEHRLFLVRKPGSVFSDGGEKWLVPGKTFDVPWESYTKKRKDEIIFNILKAESPIPEIQLKNANYEINSLGSWSHRKNNQDFIFNNYVISYKTDCFKHLPDNGRIARDSIKGESFTLLDLPIGTMSDLTQDFFKSSLFHSSGYIPSPSHPNDHKEFEKCLSSDNKKYFLYKSIGGGGYGRVYLTLDIATLLPRVVKVPLANPRDENWQERFLLEGKALLSLIHERVQNIEEIFSINRVADGHYYMLKEYIRGEDLQKSNAVKTEHVVGIIREVVKALVEVHKFGICHRDLKPNNIMVEFVENKPRITLIDFGLVKKASSETSSDPGLTTDKFRTGNVIFQSIVTYNHYKQHNFLDDYYSVLHTFYWLVNKKSFYDDHYNLTWQEVAKKVIECKAKYSDPFLDEEIVKGHCRNWGDANCINTFIKFQNIVAEGYKDIYKISKRGLTVKNRTGIHMQLNEVSEKIMGVFQ